MNDMWANASLILTRLSAEQLMNLAGGGADASQTCASHHDQT